MTDLLIYRGLPGSGKTTAARLWVEVDPANRVRVNRDDLRRMLHDGYVFADGDSGRLDHAAEVRVTVARDLLIEAFLKRGISVACDDTNLASRYARDIAKIGRRAGADVFVRDLTDVPLELCLIRDEQREQSVGADVIRSMYQRYLAGGRKLGPLDSESESDADTVAVYVARPGTLKAIMVDLDGTLCLHDGRGPYDETLVSTDLPNPPVVETIRAFAGLGYLILFVSGRSSACASDTQDWIAQHVGYFDGGLLMREVGDRRRDSIVKRELFDEHIRDQYDVAFVLDDRQQVVDAWREIGLTVFQVAPGAF